MNRLDRVLQVKSLEDDGYFRGYASVFDCIDHQGDQVRPGAFQETLKEWQGIGKYPQMLWQHDRSKPVGQWLHMHEDANGLWVEGKLLLDLNLGREAYVLLKQGVIDGLSIGFQIDQASRDHHTGVNYLEKVKLWEVSLVTFAANPWAKVMQVKQTHEIPECLPNIKQDVQKPAKASLWQICHRIEKINNRLTTLLN